MIDTRWHLRLLLWTWISSGQFHQLLQQLIHLHGTLLSKAVPEQIEEGLIGKIYRKRRNKWKLPLQGSWKSHPALRACRLDLGGTCRTDDVGVWAHEDRGFGCFQADRALEVFLLLFDCLLEKLDHLCSWSIHLRCGFLKGWFPNNFTNRISEESFLITRTNICNWSLECGGDLPKLKTWC